MRKNFSNEKKIKIEEIMWAFELLNYKYKIILNVKEMDKSCSVVKM
jgi:hypothetical protein